MTCTTTTTIAFLRWQNSNGVSVSIDATASVGFVGTLDNITLKLISATPISGAIVYTSTATLSNIVQDTTIQCDDGLLFQRHTLQVISKCIVIINIFVYYYCIR